MSTENNSFLKTLKKATDKIYGGLKMSWLAVILYAVGAAILTAAVLIIPVFKDTSVERIGVHLEAWIFFAVIIMANCKKPLESALKTFVFFLISQPLIYLLQVPFSWQGWGLFAYYKTWAIWTAATFPMAFVGWFIVKKNWWSVLILTAANCFLAYTAVACFSETFKSFPHLLLAGLFCVFQIVLYILVFFPCKWQKLVGFALPVLCALIVAIITHPWSRSMMVSDYLPDEPSLSQSAVLTVEDSEIADVQLDLSGDTARVTLELRRLGTTTFTVKDGEKEYVYTLRVYDNNGSYYSEITPVKTE